MGDYTVMPIVGAPIVPQYSFSQEIINAYADLVMRDPHNRFAAAMNVCNGDHVAAHRLLHETNNDNEFTRLVYDLRQRAAPDTRVKKKEDFMDEVVMFYNNCKNEVVKLKAMEFYAELAEFIKEETNVTNVQVNVMTVPPVPSENDWEKTALKHQHDLQEEARVINAATS